MAKYSFEQKLIFFGLLKQEIYYGVVYYSYEELKTEPLGCIKLARQPKL